jgi:hypothetical protein
MCCACPKTCKQVATGGYVPTVDATVVDAQAAPAGDWQGHQTAAAAKALQAQPAAYHNV